MHVLPRSSYPVHVHSGKRIEGRIDLDVFDGEEGEHIYDLIKPLGKHYSTNCELEIDMLHSGSARAYEIRSAGNLLKTIRFLATLTTSAMCMKSPRYVVQNSKWPCILYFVNHR